MERLYRWWINPQVHAQFHLVATLFWIVMIIPTLFWWKSSVSYLVAISLYAIITGHFSSYEATRAEIITKRQIEGEFDDIDKENETLEDLVMRKKDNT